MVNSRRLTRKIIYAIIIIGIIVALAILFGLFRQSSIDPEAEKPLTSEQVAQLIPRGRELALAGDCFGCHSLPEGPMAAGGVPISTPFGTIYSTNITPDKQFGIGNYTRADFHRALKDGIGKDKGNLFPAMPYVFTHITTPEDLDALYAYMMSIPPMPVPNKDNTGAFGLPVRPFMNFWTLFNFPDHQAPNDPHRSAEWNRGAYIVEGLAHCGACHSPRNFMMGVDFSRSLEGGEVDNMAIPDITAPTLSKHGYDTKSLSQFLQTGISPQGTSFAGMNTVTHFSTSQMKPEDVNDMAIYLLTDKNGQLLDAQPAPQPLAQAANPQANSLMEAGRLTYMSTCAGCHGVNGEGIPNGIPALKGNAIVMMDNPQTFINVVLNGIPTTVFPNGQRMYAMPGFADDLDAQEIADLISWARANWGGQEVPVTTDQVEKQKK
ncbi:cytochrome c [Providencia sneebia]|uniref:Dehydrogenase, cytochrome C subunit n=1 Tax=Providencia sneebia DSM 19967 TaxID=1141660 RepID=K8W356_9GAMM|nr:cytochrome c [Providencia sneebia]EKT54266.1 dehydrogenase, cytochrome C subunit [Providencia sneebia DSM 19967]